MKDQSFSKYNLKRLLLPSDFYKINKTDISYFRENALQNALRRVKTRFENDFNKVNSSSTYNLIDLAVAFHNDVHGYKCSIERSFDRKTVGCLLGDFGHKSDPINEYCIVLLTNNIKIEFVKEM